MILPFLRQIEPFILDPEVSEIMVNGPEHVFIERRGFLEEVPVTLNPKSLLVAVKNVARRLGSDISDEKPILDSRLPDGSRVAAVIPPCSLTGVTLTIRKFNAPNFGLPELIASGSLTQEAAALLIKAVLDHLGVPHEDGFFAKDADITAHLTEGWQQRVWEKFRASYPPAALLFYVNHLAWEVAQSEDVFAPAA